MTDNTKIDEKLLDKVANDFVSTFKYAKYTTRIETKVTDSEGNESTNVEEITQYLLIESDTIMGHYKYNYEEKTVQNDSRNTTNIRHYL